VFEIFISVSVRQYSKWIADNGYKHKSKIRD